MTKTALMFPGQASQYVGMGKELYESFVSVRTLYELASNELGVDIAQLSFEGPAEELKKTRFTQPAILLHALSVLTVLGDNIPSFDFACGHSLGEYAALAVTKAMTFEDAIKAVVKRASFMEDACQQNPGTMAAIIGLDGKQVEEICKEASSVGIVVPANYNSRIQIAISGTLPAIEEAIKLAKERKAKRAILLEVGGAFHSLLMEPAQKGLEPYLNNLSLTDPIVPVVANVTGYGVTKSEELKQLLVKQITAPVKWAQTMNYLINNDVKTVIEIGPGKVLSGLAKRDMKPEKIINLDTLSDINKYLSVEV